MVAAALPVEAVMPSLNVIVGAHWSTEHTPVIRCARTAGSTIYPIPPEVGEEDVQLFGVGLSLEGLKDWGDVGGWDQWQAQDLPDQHLSTGILSVPGCQADLLHL